MMRDRVPARRGAAVPAAGLLAAGLLATGLAACGEQPELVPSTVDTATARPLPSYAADSRLPAARAALALVPATATEVTVTDFDESRAALGVPDLTSDALATDRSAYWERARTESVLLAEGMLREHDSELLLDHGFTSDDVDWEAHWTGPEGEGWALGLRPGLDVDRIRSAVTAGVGPLAGARVDAPRHLVTGGTSEVAADGESWGDLPDVRDLATEAPAESAYYRTGCVPLDDALGPDAGTDVVERVATQQDVPFLDDLERFSMSFADGTATARLGLGRDDLLDRSDVAADFPTVGPVGWRDAFANPVNDPASGRIGWDVTTPRLAAGLVLTDVLPFAVCPDVDPGEEPTGL
ncbi:MAG TPA: hypothetical protein VF728_06760 [Nocardioides sp.]